MDVGPGELIISASCSCSFRRGQDPQLAKNLGLAKSEFEKGMRGDEDEASRRQRRHRPTCRRRTRTRPDRCRQKPFVELADAVRQRAHHLQREHRRLVHQEQEHALVDHRHL